MTRDSRLEIPGLAVVVELVGAALAATTFAAATVLFGYHALLVLSYMLLVLGVVLYPRALAVVLLVLMIVIEPAAYDFTAPISNLLYSTDNLRFLPLTMTPLEALLLLLALSLIIRAAPRLPVRLPALVWAAPVVFAMGIAYGVLRHHGAVNNAYEEARGPVFAFLGFFIVLRMRDLNTAVVRRALLVASSGLAILLLARYVVYQRLGGSTDVAQQFQYAHEDVIFLGIGFAVAGVLLLRTGTSSRTRTWLLLHEALVLAATAASGRRAGTLVMAVISLVLLWMLLPKRPVLITAITGLTIVFGGLYLGAYWHQDYGAVAQPARAIRSQIAPNARDNSSDTYRLVELYDVTKTLRLNTVFGVGFGRPFIAFQPLPSLSWWSLQYYTPHSNILWPWLKTGIIGMSVLLGIWVLALRRCLTAARDAPALAPVPLVPLVVAASLVAFLTFSSVDLLFVGSRSMVPFGMTVATAFLLCDAPTAPTEDEQAAAGERAVSTRRARAGMGRSRP